MLTASLRWVLGCYELALSSIVWNLDPSKSELARERSRERERERRWREQERATTSLLPFLGRERLHIIAEWTIRATDVGNVRPSCDLRRLVRNCSFTKLFEIGIATFDTELVGRMKQSPQGFAVFSVRAGTIVQNVECLHLSASRSHRPYVVISSANVCGLPMTPVPKYTE